MVFLASCIHAFKLVFKSLSSLPSPFRVIIGLQLHWMGDKQVGEKEKKIVQFGVFSRRAVVRSSLACLFQRQKFLRKFPNISGFYLGLPSFSPAAARDMQYIFSYHSRHCTLLFREILEREMCTLVKGEESLHPLEKISKPSLFFFINSDMFSSSVISVISLSMAE